MEKGIRCIPEWVSNSGNAILYEELLSVQDMPPNPKSYFQHAIRANILSFIKECELEKHEHTYWQNAFIQTAHKRMESANANQRVKKQYERSIA